MNGKMELWTVTWINNKSVMCARELEDLEEVMSLLSNLKNSGQDMDYVSVFAPKTNLTYEELEELQ